MDVDLGHSDGDVSRPELCGVNVEVTSPYSSEVSRIPLDRPLLVGRRLECDVRLVDPRVSRRHARLTLTEHGRILVEDLGSANGTGIATRTLHGEMLTAGLPAFVHIEPFVLTVRCEGDSGETTFRAASPGRMRIRVIPGGIEVDGVAVAAAPQERRLLEILAVSFPDPVRHAEIAATVWEGEDWAPHMLQNLVRRCRERLRSAGVGDADPIVNVRGYGYRLCSSPPAAAEGNPTIRLPES